MCVLVWLFFHIQAVIWVWYKFLILLLAAINYIERDTITNTVKQWHVMPDEIEKIVPLVQIKSK